MPKPKDRKYTETFPEGSAYPVYTFELTKAEEAERDASHKQYLQAEQDKLNRLKARASALAKLQILGLTEEEAQALIG